MKLRSFFLLFLVATLAVPGFPVLAGSGINIMQQQVVWSFDELGRPELSEGLSGSFFGLQDDYLIMAGGSSFPEGKPWEGGVKKFSDLVLVFERNASGRFNLLHQSQSLPVPLSEGASAIIAGGLLCVGGQTPDGLSAKVQLIRFDGRQITISEYPDLPLALRSPAAAIIGTRIYVAGGESEAGPSDGFFVFDTGRPQAGWQELVNLPMKISGASMVARSNGEETSLFLFGGRAKNMEAGITDFYSNVFQFSPSKGQWIQKNDIASNLGEPVQLAMAVAVPLGATHVLLAGGDTGHTFRLVEQAIGDLEKGNDSARQIRDSLWINHPGFNPRLLVYNIITDTWFDAGNYDGVPFAVGSATVSGNTVIIAGGEIKPGVRTPFIRQLRFTVNAGFGWLNNLVLIVYFGGMLLLGFYFMKKDGDTGDFFLASGRIPWWAAGISIFATTLSAITFIAIPAKTYATDWRMLMFNLTIIMIAPVVIRFFLPFFRRFNFDTAYQYLEFRFSRSVRWLASALFIFFMISRIAIVLFLPSLALNAVTGFSIYYSIIIMGVVTIIYCTSGGIEAVIWGDVVQGFILVAGALAAFAFMVGGVEGGIGTFWTTAIEHNKFHTFDFRFDFSQPVFWVVLLGGLANTLITYTSDQSVVQRYMTTKDEKATARSIWLNGFLSIPVSVLFFLLGTGLYVFYISNPEQMAITSQNIDSVFPQFIVSELPQGLAGLLVAAIFAAAMSTLSSNINSVAAVITSDFYKTIGREKSSLSGMRVARGSGIAAGLLGIAMALMLATWDIASLWDQFNTFLGLLTGGLGALFIMGIFIPRIGSKAALAGVACGLAVLLWVKSNTDASFLLYGFTGMTASVAMAFLISFLLPGKKPEKGSTWWSI